MDDEDDVGSVPNLLDVHLVDDEAAFWSGGANYQGVSSITSP